ncbi:OsmC family protein [Thiopseudomonas denitrificans]|uniref:Putative OsmC-like protein n=1 Tax=Thiopseudomonas denitrificans TaxID=1501432 RepID=A0A4R6TWE4_9GAMM|nr:OsmC family protein [Thiopseudomonas denitrificans]TDQ36155.1 putative OsmC-like protein [Thiopseudomonas denitrificans]
MALKTLRATGHMGAGMTIEIMCGEHKVFMDQPKNAGGADLGPAPPELILAAYAGCVGSIGRIMAHQEKINLRGMRFEVEADYDPDRLLGRETSARTGFQQIRLNVEIDADLDDAAKQDFLQRIEARCPILDNLANETPVVSRLAG